MKRKLLLILITLLMLTVGLAAFAFGCSPTPDPDNGPQSSTDGGDVEDDGGEEEETGDETPAPQPESLFKDVVFEDLIMVYDGEYHTIKAKNIPEYATYKYSTNKGYKDVGEHKITLNLSMNGEKKEMTAKLTVTKATLTVYAQEEIQFFGQTPRFDYTVVGFKGNDDISDIDNLPTAVATDKTLAGKYENEVSFSGAVDNNYDFTYVKADYIIEQAATPIASGGYFLFGKYPQTVVTDPALIEELDGKVLSGELGTDSDTGWYNYNGKSYLAAVAKPHEQADSYKKFVSGVTMEEGKNYFFEVSPIKWRVLTDDGEGNYTLITDTLIDVLQFNDSKNNVVNGEVIEYANDWTYSSLREWLNNEFLNNVLGNSSAVTEIEHTITNTVVDSHTYTTTVRDKVRLLSIAEAESLFTKDDASRKAEHSDYSRAKGAYMPTDGCGYWWLINAGGVSGSDSARVRVVKNTGYCGDADTAIDNFFGVINTSCGIRPLIQITV